MIERNKTYVSLYDLFEHSSLNEQLSLHIFLLNSFYFPRFFHLLYQKKEHLSMLLFTKLFFFYLIKKCLGIFTHRMRAAMSTATTTA